MEGHLYITTNTYLRSFQYKIPNNILYLNEIRFVFGLSTTSSCSFYNFFGENITHFFCCCTITQYLWKKLQLTLKNIVTFPPLLQQAGIFVFLEADCQSYLFQSHILLISKLYIYKSRKNKFVK